MAYTKISAIRETSKILDFLTNKPKKQVLFEEKLVIGNTYTKELIAIYGIKAIGYELKIKVIKGDSIIWETVGTDTCKVRFILKGILNKISNG